jgi:cell division septal protein FtsQ
MATIGQQTSKEAERALREERRKQVARARRKDMAKVIGLVAAALLLVLGMVFAAAYLAAVAWRLGGQ